MKLGSWGNNYLPDPIVFFFALRRGSRQAFESIFKREGAPPPGLPKAFDYYTDF